VTRRKGERPLVKPLAVWSDQHPVAHMIRTGDYWFTAWRAQECTPYGKLSKMTGIPVRRLMEIELRGVVSRAEVEALAKAWCVSSSNLEAAMGGACQIVP